MKSGPTFGDAMQLDQALYQLASYDAAKGLIMIPETADQAIEMQKGIAKRFNYFKRLIQNSEVSFGELQRTVVERNGPYASKVHNMTTEQVIEKVIEDSRKEDDSDSPKEMLNVLQKLFGDIVKMSGQDPRLLDCVDCTEDTEEKDMSKMENNPYLFADDTDSPPKITPEQPKKEDSPKGKNGRTKSKSNKNPKGKRDT